MEGDESVGKPTDAVVFVGISLVLGIASRHILRGTRIPYTVALLIIGIGLGSLEYGTRHGLGKIGAGIRLWANINPELLLSVFLPALLFESSFSMEVHQIKKCMAQMLLLAGPGVFISTLCLGTAVKMTFPYGWNWKTSLLLGGLLSATDPVAVVALLKELGASKKLSTIIEGESLMNDGTAIVVYQLFYKMALGSSFTAGDIVTFLSKVSLGAVAVGLAFGIASVLWLGFMFNDTVIEITLTLAVSYIAYFTAQDAIDVSGVLTVMSLGMFYAAVAKTAFKGDGQQSLHHFWEMVAYIANTLIFILSGVVIAEEILNNYNRFEKQGTSWGYLFLLYVFVQLSRLIVVSALYPFLRCFGYGLGWKEAIILMWSGLRGAVALSLSLSVYRTSDIAGQSDLKREVGILFVFFTGGIVFLTLIINGSTTQFVLRLLGMDKLSETKIRILNYTKYEMLNKALEAFGDLGDDEELGPADWPTVQNYITCLNNLDEEQVHPHLVSESDHHLQATNLRDIRVRLLNGVQAAYWAMLEEGRITQNTACLLMRSVDEAMDVVSTEPLCDWKGLKSNVRFPSYYRFLQVTRLPRRLITYFTVERLESACYICAAFLRAHRIARRQLHDFIGDSDIATTVINESKEEGEEACKFLEDVRVAFPQVLRVVKTKQVTYSVLKHLSDYVQNLKKVGLLEEKEMIHLDDAVQTDLKRLLRNPPLVKMPRASDILRTHPLLGALPSEIWKPIAGSTKEIIKIRGTVLYKEGSKPNGIWLISVGVVKWSSNILANRHSLHPTFSHGSTIGLYEVLIGKPYICDIITDSVVHCFFLETEKIHSLLALDPSIEDFLWQESAIVLAKLLLPQKFEKMSMHEVRALVAERSTMNIYLRGEVIEIRPNSIGFLLEGFIKSQNPQQELITSPAALLPSIADSGLSYREFSGKHKPRTLAKCWIMIAPAIAGIYGSFFLLSVGIRYYFLRKASSFNVLDRIKSSSFCHTGSPYQVETRARVITFDISAPEADVVLLKGSTSRLSSSIEPTRSHYREHEGLLSWPENFYKLKDQTASEADKRPNNFSSKAMELSIYGSKMNGVRRQYRSFRSFRSFKMRPQAKAAHSLSYPRVQASATDPQPLLLSVQSEGRNMNRRIGSKEYAKLPSFPPLLTRRKKAKAGEDNSSDESGGEDVIVRIDSPSSLSFRHEGSQV